MKNIPHVAPNGYIQMSFLDLPTTKHRTCQLCNVCFLPSNNSAGLYCSHRCAARSRWINHKRPQCTCKTCGIEFTQHPCTEGIYCSRKCMGIGSRRKTVGNCLYCNKEMIFKSSMNKIYCSPQCRNNHLNRTLPRKTVSKWSAEQLAYLKKHYLTDGGSEVAKVLGKTHDQVVDKANKIKISNSRIGMISRMHRNQPSGYELRIRQDLDSLNIFYDTSIVIKDKFIVDIKIDNLIIEADGDYWHGHPRFEPLTERQLKQQKRDAARNKYLLTCGYQVERIWENDYSIEHLKTILHKHHII